MATQFEELAHELSLIVAGIFPKLPQPLAAELKVLAEFLPVFDFVERPTTAVVQSRPNHILEIVADHLLIVKCDALGIFWLKLTRHTLAQREKECRPPENGLVARTNPRVDALDEFVRFAARVKFHASQARLLCLLHP